MASVAGRVGRDRGRSRSSCRRATSSSRASSDRSATGHSVFARPISSATVETRCSSRSTCSASSESRSSDAAASSWSSRRTSEAVSASVASTARPRAPRAPPGLLRERAERLAQIVHDRLDPRARLEEVPVQCGELVLLLLEPVGRASTFSDRSSTSRPSGRASRRSRREPFLQLLLRHAARSPSSDSTCPRSVVSIAAELVGGAARSSRRSSSRLPERGELALASGEPGGVVETVAESVSRRSGRGARPSRRGRRPASSVPARAVGLQSCDRFAEFLELSSVERARSLSSRAASSSSVRRVPRARASSSQSLRPSSRWRTR